MRESTYTAAVNKLARAAGLFVWKINAAYAAGVPDAYYEGHRSHLWVEFKYLPKPGPQFKADLTALQHKWLADRHANGNNVAVVVGSPLNAWWYDPLAWTDPVDRDTVEAQGLTKHDVVNRILAVTGQDHATQNRRSPNR